ncbi:hypothetical protein C2E23DRAFT_883015 [Lenzites betulinus]|nr:hypothetical protein C2E23DRAFT_883015 [Lenzites betulinus]
MHTYNLRSRPGKNAVSSVYQDLIAKGAYGDPKHIEITVSATGKGHHIRWHWSEASIEDDNDTESSRSSSPSHDAGPSNVVDHVDDDGDSQMGDEEEEERMRTPLREVPYDPGSVVLTPRRARIIRREPRIGGGFDFWHEQDGVLHRLAFSPDGKPLAPSEPGAQELHPDTQHIRDAIEAYRRSVTPFHGADEYLEDDDDARSVCSEATVLIDPRATPEPTLRNGAMPLVRHPTIPVDVNAPGPSRAPLLGRLSTIQEGSQELSWPARSPQQWSGMRILRNAAGEWIREGSLGPDAEYQVNMADFPPRVDRDGEPAPAPAPAPRVRAVPLRRTDTEPCL